MFELLTCNPIPFCLRFVGTTDFAPGKWVEVELEDCQGKNNGTVNGKEYMDSLFDLVSCRHCAMCTYMYMYMYLIHVYKQV